MASIQQRYWLKAISWEGLSNTAAFLIAYLIFGHPWDCFLFTILIVALKIIGYYYHEKWWGE